MANRPQRGRDASSPWAIPLRGWKDVIFRSWREASDDNIGLVAAGVAFYGFLALVPLLGAMVLSYGLVADPQTVVHNMQALTSVMPTEAAKLVGEQLMNVVKASSSKKGLGLLLALAIALFGARNAAGSIVTALNIAYEEKEKRSFITVNLLALAITGVGVLVAVLAVIAIAALGHLEGLLPRASGFAVVLGKLFSYVALTLAGAAGAATLYRFGPSREKPRWVWLTPGSVFAAVLWLALTLGFGVYVANFGKYNATYGSLGAVVILLTWLYLSSYALLFGAELNAELEHQTGQDTTAGPSEPIGQRGAWVADHVAGETQLNVAVALPSLPSAQHATPKSQPSLPADYVTARTTSRFGPMLGSRTVGMVSSAIATIGLGLIRRKGRATHGTALIVLAAGLNWLRRDQHEGK